MVPMFEPKQQYYQLEFNLIHLFYYLLMAMAIQLGKHGYADNKANFIGHIILQDYSYKITFVWHSLNKYQNILSTKQYLILYFFQK